MPHHHKRHARAFFLFKGGTADAGFLRDGGVVGQQAFAQARLTIRLTFSGGGDAQIRIAQKGNGADNKLGPACGIAQGNDFVKHSFMV